MATTPPLSLNNLIDITVAVAPTVTSGQTFNQGLCIGPSPVIPSQGANSRIQQFSSTTAMLSAGFSTSDPEFIEMQLYFSQTPPPSFGWVGRQDLTAIGSLALDAGGAGWAIGDTFNVVQSGASFGMGTVTAMTAGVATAVSFISGSQGSLQQLSARPLAAASPLISPQWARRCYKPLRRAARRGPSGTGSWPLIRPTRITLRCLNSQMPWW